MVLRNSVIAQLAHALFPPRRVILSEQRKQHEARFSEVSASLTNQRWSVPPPAPRYSAHNSPVKGTWRPRCSPRRCPPWSTRGRQRRSLDDALSTARVTVYRSR